MLDLFAQEGVRAVFFILGERLQTPGAIDIVRRAASEGHLIGNHSMTHRRLTELPPDQIEAEILRTRELIADFEPKQKLFRPPYGAWNNSVISVAKRLGYKTVLWNVDSQDWKAENQPTRWVDIAIEGVQQSRRSVCLFHDYNHTADHLPEMVRRMKQIPGCQFVGYDEPRDLVTYLGDVTRVSFHRTKRLLKLAPN